MRSTGRLAGWILVLAPLVAFSDMYQASTASRRDARVTDGMIVSGEFYSGLGVRTAAGRAGFIQEGRTREAASLFGERVDEINYGLLRSEWRPDDGPE